MGVEHDIRGLRGEWGGRGVATRKEFRRPGEGEFSSTVEGKQGVGKEEGKEEGREE